MYEAITQDQLSHRMLSQMMSMEQKMASKEDITGMEVRMMSKMQSEVQTIKTDQQEFKSQVEERIKQFETRQLKKMQDLEQKLQQTSISASSNQASPVQPSIQRNRMTEVDDDDETRRKKQILVGGIDKEQDYTTTTHMLKDLVSKLVGHKANIEVGTLTERNGSLGTLTFQVFSDKIKCYKLLRQQQHNDYEQLSFFDNLTFQERILEKRLGLLKHFMLKTNEHDADDVKVIWRKQIVTLRNRKIAWYDEANQIQMTKAAKKHQDEVENALEEWIRKRSHDDPATDSEWLTKQHLHDGEHVTRHAKNSHQDHNRLDVSILTGIADLDDKIHEEENEQLDDDPTNDKGNEDAEIMTHQYDIMSNQQRHLNDHQKKRPTNTIEANPTGVHDSHDESNGDYDQQQQQQQQQQNNNINNNIKHYN